MSQSGMLIILTGGNGAGKGTIGPLAAKQLSQETGESWSYIYGPRANGYTTSVRSLVLNPDPATRPSDYLADALLWFSQHAETAKVVVGLRASGKNIILDRYAETTLVYNVYGRDLQSQFPWVVLIYRSLIEQIQPDLGIVLDVSAEESLRRSGKQAETDHYQQQEIDSHDQRRQYFAAFQFDRGWVLVDAMPPVEVVLESVLQEIRKIASLRAEIKE